MAILASFDLSPTKSAVKTSLSGTTALDDSFEIRATAPSQLSSFQVVGGSLIFTLYTPSDNTVSTINLPNFGSSNFIEFVNRNGSANALYNTNFKIVNNLDNSKSTETLIIVGTEGSDTISARDTKGTTVSFIYGGAGNDTINGGSATSTIYAGSGVNTLSGSGGDSFYRAFTQDKATDTIVDSSGIDSIGILLPSTMGSILTKELAMILLVRSLITREGHTVLLLKTNTRSEVVSKAFIYGRWAVQLMIQ